MSEIKYLEDDPVIGEVVKRTIERSSSYKLTVQHRLEDFWKVITPSGNLEPPAIFLLDVDLGDTNCNAQGGDVARMIRSRPKLENAPILFITGLIPDMDEVRKKIKTLEQNFNNFYQIEGNYYTSKALISHSENALLECIEEVIANHQLTLSTT